MSTVTERRLGLELAEKGYGGSDDECEDTAMDEDDMVEIVKAAHDLRKASQATRVRYKVGFSIYNPRSSSPLLILDHLLPCSILFPVCRHSPAPVRTKCQSQA